MRIRTEINVSKELEVFYSLSHFPNGDMMIGEALGYRFEFLDEGWFLSPLNTTMWICVEESVGYWASIGPGMEKALDNFLRIVHYRGGIEEYKKEITARKEYFKKNCIHFLLQEEVQLVNVGEPNLALMGPEDMAGNA